MPCVVGTGGATSTLRDGQPVTVSCAEGEVGVVFAGSLNFTRKEIDLGSLPRPKTKVMVNAGDPDRAFALASLPCDGVGLAREEFVISGSIQVHPLALVHFDKLPDGPEEQKIAELTRNHPDKPGYFVEWLAERVAHRGRVLPARSDRPRLRLQDERVRRAAVASRSSRGKRTQ